MVPRKIDRAVRERADHRCEYCHMPQFARRFKFAIDHIVARQHRGPTSLDNLALCCGRCNRSKGPNLSGVDPMTGDKVFLFNPRTDVWAEHFRWQGALIEGSTAVGRATIEVLNMNHPDDVAVREELLSGGQFAL